MSYYAMRRNKILGRNRWRSRLRRRRPKPTGFLLRKWFTTHVGPIGFSERRTWFDRARALRREFHVYYGFNPRCHWKGARWSRKTMRASA